MPLSTTCVITLDRSIWALAVAVGEFRMKVNDQFRASIRDRGADKNRLNDLQGTIGEIAGTIRAEGAYGICNVRNDLIDFTGPVDSVDLTITGQAQNIGLEAKCLLWDGTKKWFLVNQEAHNRSIRRGANGYIPVLSSVGNAKAIVGPIIPVEALEGWKAPPYRLNDPAIGVELHPFCFNYMNDFKGGWKCISTTLLAPESTKIFSQSELLVELPKLVEERREQLTQTFLGANGNGIVCLAAEVAKVMGV